ncbi:MAG: glycoside hydrolase family 43 protein [Candidatus Cloacimonetes bacterium]|nr:glycoside hydrolase family 43 protein [Candidatus Cloacimonadota bacterium]
MKKNFIYAWLFLSIAPLASCQSCSSEYRDVDGIVVREVETPMFFGDPFIMLHEDVYYAYGTNADDGIEVYTSDDLKEWKKVPELALHKNNSYGEKWFWAPEVYYVNGKFYMYYYAEEHICVAVADSPFGPFKQSVQKPMIEGEKTIDNSLFIDDDGKPYLFFDRFNDGLNIWVAELEDDLITIKTETLHPCIHVSQEWEEVWPRVNEGAFVVKHNGIYFMTYSANSYESPFYGIGCATATDILGEWTKYSDNPLLQKPGNLVGVGHSAMFRDKKGNLRVVFHAHHDEKNIHPRKMYVGKAGFKEVDGVDKLYIEEQYEIPVLAK